MRTKVVMLPRIGLFTVTVCLLPIVGGLLVDSQLLEAKWHNLRCHAHCYATDYYCSAICVYHHGF